MRKLIHILLIGLILVTPFSPYIIPKVNASETNYVQIGQLSSTLRMRTSPSTANDSNHLLWIPVSVSGQVFRMIESVSASNGCAGNWYQIDYSGNTGYVCSDIGSGPYIFPYDPSKFTFNTSYDRPWTSPKKAIVGGAKFISSGYISRGQFTSYLKKFNVNPNGYYSVHTHQYMANLEAPSSEALTSYNALSRNGLLNQAYNFIIPVYSDMPADTYDASIRTTYPAAIGEIHHSPSSDASFENGIAGFPDTYKPYLRYLHTIYPTWTFTPLMTGLNFNSSVQIQKRIGSIQGTYRYQKYDVASQCSFTFESNTGYCRTEPGWYVANDQAVAFFLDPRNFLSERYIFMFENLGYSTLYTENTVQSALNNTFMSDLSVLDNQRYASIFVEAGQIADVSPLYLASLARQESGVSLTLTTDGRAFDYNGFYYSGLYNFFNIGALSSESNPAKAGLVYANGGPGGNSHNSGGTQNPTNPVEPVDPRDLVDFISLLNVKTLGNYVRGYESETTVSKVKSIVGSQAEVIIRNVNNEIKTDASFIGTGDSIFIDNGRKSATYKFVMYGDLTGDGKINSADLLRMRQHLLGTAPLTNEFLASGEVTGDNLVNSADLLKLRQHLLGQIKIGQ